MNGRISSSGRRIALRALAGAAVFLLVCTTFTIDAVAPWSSARNEKLKPGRLTVAWTNAIEKHPGKTAWRGFRGKVQFFAEADGGKGGSAASKGPSRPMTVDGMLTVYAIDETAGVRTRSGPPRKFVFNAKELKKLVHEADKDPWYGVWIPWETVGGPKRKLRLLVRFDAVENGPVLMSDDVRVVLPDDTGTKAAAGKSE